MLDSITDVVGIEVGHAGDERALTGCSVVLCRAGGVVGVDVRGSAPGTRETDLCRPGTLINEAHAIFLSGGSAFGLDATGGVMRFLWEQGVGLKVGVATVPIVPAAVIFDLGVGEPEWPDADLAYQACRQASGWESAQGCVGAGMGASVGKLFGPAHAVKSGLGTASIRLGAVTVGALMVVNAVGDVVNPAGGAIIAGARRHDDQGYRNSTRAILAGHERAGQEFTSTTIGVVATDARLDSSQVNYLATIAHDGLARTIRPVHTMLDGDTIFSLSTGRAGDAPDDALMSLAAATVVAAERAVLNAMRATVALGGLPAPDGSGGESEQEAPALRV